MAGKIEVLRHFSIPIFSCAIDGFASHKEPLAEALRRVRGRSEGIRQTNRHSWHSEANLHESDDTEIRWACESIVAFALGAVADLHGGFRTTAPRISECWSVIGARGAWHTPHQHHPRPWSGVFYVSAEDCVSKTDPNDRSGKIEFLNPVSVAHAFFSAQSIAYGPRDGVVLLFPGALQHMVHPNETDNERVIMSFNLEIGRK